MPFVKVLAESQLHGEIMAGLPDLDGLSRAGHFRGSGSYVLSREWTKVKTSVISLSLTDYIFCMDAKR